MDALTRGLILFRDTFSGASGFFASPFSGKAACRAMGGDFFRTGKRDAFGSGRALLRR
jgi:hypothetical protein